LHDAGPVGRDQSHRVSVIERELLAVDVHREQRVVIVRLVMVDPTTPMMLAFVVPLALLWAVERASKLARPLVRAETDGPPRERVTWKADWFGRRRYLSRAVRAVAEGQFVSNPKGMRLVGHEAGASAQLRVEAKSTIKWT
jgi:hypothetical protein